MEKLKIVRNMESDEREVLGTYVGTEEDTVFYCDNEGLAKSAPEDCVQVEDAPDGLPLDTAGPVAGHTDEVIHADGTVTDRIGNFVGIDQPRAAREAVS